MSINKNNLAYCLSIKDFARYIGMSQSFIEHNWMQLVTEYKIRYYRIGCNGRNRKRIVFNRADIDRMMEREFLAGGKQ